MDIFGGISRPVVKYREYPAWAKVIRSVSAEAMRPVALSTAATRCAHSSRRRQPADVTWRGGGRWLAETETGSGGDISLRARSPESLQLRSEWRSVGRQETAARTAFQPQARTHCVSFTK